MQRIYTFALLYCKQFSLFLSFLSHSDTVRHCCVGWDNHAPWKLLLATYDDLSGHIWPWVGHIWSISLTSISFAIPGSVVHEWMNEWMVVPSLRPSSSTWCCGIQSGLGIRGRPWNALSANGTVGGVTGRRAQKELHPCVWNNVVGGA